MRGHHADAMTLQQPRTREVPTNTGRPFKPRSVRTPFDRTARKLAGKRSRTETRRKRGRYVRSRLDPGNYRDIALDATMRQAAPHQAGRSRGEMAIAIKDEDLCRKVRVRKAANLILFAVDASWSMAAAERMEATKGAVLSLLIDAYQKRDRVCLVVFQKETARVVLPPTSSAELAQRELRRIPVGGKTPLSAGLLLSYEVIERERRRSREVMPLMILLTDGAGNVSMTGLPAQEEALRVAGAFAREQIHAVVINTEHVSLDRGLAQELAQAMHSPCYTLDALKAENLYDTVQSELLRLRHA